MEKVKKFLMCQPEQTRNEIYIKKKKICFIQLFDILQCELKFPTTYIFILNFIFIFEILFSLFVTTFYFIFVIFFF